ncbi:MAG: hypothetical protein IJ412_01680 [Oscillospiraceae bacterium]|nr:hypothetical protein [Oscillospiraceae bacterium]
MSTYNIQQLMQLRRHASAIEQALQTQKAASAQGYAAQQAALNAGREDQLRQAYVSQQQALAQLPGQLLRRGLNGGFAESSLRQLNRDYDNQRADIHERWLQEYNKLLAKKAAADAKAAEKAAKAASGRKSGIVKTDAADTVQEETTRKKPAGPGLNSSLVGHTSLVR